MMAYQQDCPPLMRLDEMQAPLPLTGGTSETAISEDGKFTAVPANSLTKTANFYAAEKLQFMTFWTCCTLKRGFQ